MSGVRHFLWNIGASGGDISGHKMSAGIAIGEGVDHVSEAD